MMIESEILTGNNISQADLNLINEYRSIRHGRNNVWSHESNNHFHDRIFFLIRNNQDLVAFGTLREIEIFVDEEKFDILGIQLITSIIQGKGYGKELMQQMIKFANENERVLIGFCIPENRAFYEKSGIQVFPNRNLNFVYINEQGEGYTEQGDVIYYSESPSNIQKAIEANQLIKHYVPHW